MFHVVPRQTAILVGCCRLGQPSAKKTLVGIPTCSFWWGGQETTMVQGRNMVFVDTTFFHRSRLLVERIVSLTCARDHELIFCVAALVASKVGEMQQGLSQCAQCCNRLSRCSGAQPCCAIWAFAYAAVFPCYVQADPFSITVQFIKRQTPIRRGYLSALASPAQADTMWAKRFFFVDFALPR